MNEKNEIILFDNQGVKLEVNLKDETVWLTQEQMSQLFKKAKSTINEHIKNIYKEGELDENDTMTKFGNSEFSDKPTNYYNLDMIISVGYRVKSQNGILFRKWATKILKDYMLKGYAINQKRFESIYGNDFYTLINHIDTQCLLGTNLKIDIEYFSELLGIDKSFIKDDLDRDKLLIYEKGLAPILADKYYFFQNEEWIKMLENK